MAVCRTNRILRWLALLPAVYLLALSLPLPDFRQDYSTVLLSSDGSLLGALTASDGQWRFPPEDTVPSKYTRCLVQFEDRWFFLHPGVNLFSIGRAFCQNIRQRRIVSGASTISMQLIRLSRPGESRNIWQKTYEMLAALKLELVYSKEDILKLYAAHAPFGGNVVGLEAASWRYFGIPPDQLSWGESAGLAVLPNAPSLVRPGKNEALLKAKRNRLLNTLLRRGIIDSLTYDLASEEPLPGRPAPLPRLAPHLLDRLHAEQPGSKIRSTVDYELQKAALRISGQHWMQLKKNQINNLGVVVAETRTGRILAYIGNPDWTDRDGGAVDMVRAERSSGSILKPFLYAAMLDDGKIMPGSLVPDLPVHFAGYSPKNFDLSFRGAVPASEALSRSLNLPAVWMLREYNVGRFLELLHKLGFSSLTKPADHYGLSLILGGGEVQLDELTGAYARLARALLPNGEAAPAFRKLHYLPGRDDRADEVTDVPLSREAIYSTLEALKEVHRPSAETGWQYFSSSGTVAYKTGTSFGFRDAWAVGTAYDIVIGVWAGNADGEGRPTLTGINSAAPLLFDLFNLFREDRWFEPPLDRMSEAEVCRKSGFRASAACDDVETILVPVGSLRSGPCPYHKLLHLDATGRYRVNMSCYPPDQMSTKSWFILPPAMAWFYSKANSSYTDPPPPLPGCAGDGANPMLDFIYPGPDLMVYMPRDLTGERTQVILEAAHRDPAAIIYWHLDGDYLGSTTIYHQMAITAEEGLHDIFIVDKNGNSISRQFRVVE